jgi:hypothetical protein
MKILKDNAFEDATYHISMDHGIALAKFIN